MQRNEICPRPTKFLRLDRDIIGTLKPAPPERKKAERNSDDDRERAEFDDDGTSISKNLFSFFPF